VSLAISSPLKAPSAHGAWQIADSGFSQWIGWMAAIAFSTALALF
jgi:hypothetical protein